MMYSFREAHNTSSPSSPCAQIGTEGERIKEHTLTPSDGHTWHFYYIIVEETVALRTWLMRPFSRRHMENENITVNWLSLSGKCILYTGQPFRLFVRWGTLQSQSRLLSLSATACLIKSRYHTTKMTLLTMRRIRPFRIPGDKGRTGTECNKW